MARTGPRERYRAQTIDEIKDQARRQLAEGGPEAISLNAIAKRMGMSGPALYRYVDSRDDLLADLVTEAYDDLAGTVERASGAAPDDPPDARLHAVADAYRGWATAHPELYLLTFGASTGSGSLAPDRTIPAVHRTMTQVLDALARLAHVPAPSSGRDDGDDPMTGQLASQLDDWAQRRGEAGIDPELARLGFAAWTRLHGVVSLELLGHLGQTGVDVDLLYEAEVDALVAAAAGRTRTT